MGPENARVAAWSEATPLENASTSSQTGATRVAKGFECSGIPFVQDDWERVDRAMQLRSEPFDHPTDNAAVPLTRSKRWSAGAPAPKCLTNASRSSSTVIYRPESASASPAASRN